MLLYDSGVSGNCYKVRLLLAHLGLDVRALAELDVVDRSNRAGGPRRAEPGPPRADARPRRRPRAGRVRRDPLVPRRRHGVRARRTRSTAPRCCSGCSSSSTATSRTSRSPRFWLTKGIDVDPRGARGAASASATSRFDAMESHLAGHDFLVGERYSIADIALYAYTHVADEGGFDLRGYPGDRAPGSSASPPSRATSRSQPEGPRLGAPGLGSHGRAAHGA